jgi:ATP-binding cassette subfamily F protein 3
MITVSGISKSFGERSLFEGVTFNVGPRDRIAIIGPNGSGKTTLFEVLMGRSTPDSGSVAVKKGTNFGYLEQDIAPYSDRRLLDDVVSSASATAGLAHRIEIIQQELSDVTEGQETERLLKELGELQHRFEAMEGYDADNEAKAVLSGLGFKVADFDRPLKAFSGGWLMRAEIAKLLLSNPDILLLDEPTNHLDLEACIWFEGYLSSYQGAVLVTSHDRAFLNRVVNRVFAIESRKVVVHKGDYDSYVVSRQKTAETLEATARRQEARIKEQARFIERFRAKNTKATQVQSRIKMLEKMDKRRPPHDQTDPFCIRRAATRRC